MMGETTQQQGGVRHNDTGMRGTTAHDEGAHHRAGRGGHRAATAGSMMAPLPPAFVQAGSFVDSFVVHVSFSLVFISSTKEYIYLNNF